MSKLSIEISNNIDKRYEEIYKRIINWSYEEKDETEINMTVKGIITAYESKKSKINIVLKKIENIYKKRGLTNVGVAGLSYDFSYENPDPENLIPMSKVDKSKPFTYLAKNLKILFDNNDNLKEYVPNLQDNNEKWSKSFKYWQMYITLVKELMNEKVNLDILKDVDVLGRYKTFPFEEKKDEKKDFQKRDNKKQKGGEMMFPKPPNNKKNFNKKFNKNKRNFNKKNFNKKESKEKEYENTMKNIIFEEDGEFKNLWFSTKKDMKKQLYDKAEEDGVNCEDLIIENTDMRENKVVDPLTGVIYKDLKLVTQNDIRQTKENIIRIIMKIQEPDEYETYEDLRDNSPNPAIREGLKKYEMCFKSFDTDSRSGIPAKFEKTGKSKPISVEQIQKQLDEQNIKKMVLAKHFCKDYSIFTINKLKDLKLAENVPIYYEMRDKVFIFLVEYYKYSRGVIDNFIEKLKIHFKIVNNKKNNTNINKKENIINTKEISRNRELNVLIKVMSEKDREILKKISDIISKYLPFNAKRKELEEYQKKILDKMLEKYKYKIDKEIGYEKKKFEKKENKFIKKDFSKNFDKKFNKKYNNIKNNSKKSNNKKSNNKNDEINLDLNWNNND